MESRGRRGVRRDWLRGKLRRGVWERLSDRVSGQVYLDLEPDPSTTVFLAGTARAGTTWVSDLINHRNEYRYVFEPFHPKRLPATSSFLPRQYVRRGDRDPRYLEPARAVVTGRVRSVWTDKYNRKRLVRRRLVKEVRANLLLPWLHDAFPQMRMILLLRHPCAVAHSQLRLPWNWHLDLPGFLRQRPLVEDHLEPFADLLGAEHAPFERHVLLWCVENYVPLRELPRGEVHVVLYERLCLDPEGELRRLFAFLGEEFDDAVLGRVDRPSAVARSDSAIRSGESLVAGWRERVTTGERRRAAELLAAFGLDRVYGEEPQPRVEEGEVLLRLKAPGAVPRSPSAFRG